MMTREKILGTMWAVAQNLLSREGQEQLYEDLELTYIGDTFQVSLDIDSVMTYRVVGKKGDDTRIDAILH